MAKKRSIRYRLDRLSIYLPSLVMFALALGTFWMVRQTPSWVQQVQAPSLPSDQPDYMMQDFLVRTYTADGQITSQIRGALGSHYPASNTLVVDDVRAIAINSEGAVTRASAQTGTSTDDRQELSLKGGVRVIREAHGKAPRMEFHGEELQIWPEQGRVRSDKPVEMFRGADRMKANSLDYDKDAAQIQMGGRVRSTLQPTGSGR